MGAAKKMLFVSYIVIDGDSLVCVYVILYIFCDMIFLFADNNNTITSYFL